MRQPRPSLKQLSNIAVSLSMLGFLPSAASAQDAARQSQLTALVRQDCGSCHGMTLKGGLGSALQPSDIAHLEADGIAAIILEGIPGKPMPSWRGLITEAEARWIAARLKEGFPQ